MDPGCRAAGIDRAVEPVTPIMKSRADPAGVTIRAIRPDDNAHIVDAFRALEPRSIYLRFFSPKKELSDEELRRLTVPAEARGVALVATVATADRGEIIVGLGEYVPRERSAHIAFIVEEDYQGRGIASRLLEHLARIARGHGISQFEADVLAGNTPMLDVLRHSGLQATEIEEEGVVHVTLVLGEGAR